MRLDALFPLVMPEVSGCPHPTLVLHLAMAGQRFCVETGAWAVMADEQITSEGLTEYDVEPATDAMVVRVRDVWLDGKVLKPVGVASAIGRLDVPTGYTHYDDRQVLRLNGQPSAAQKLQMRLVMAPKTNSTTIPDDLAMRHQVAIAAGAKSTLMVMPNQVWTNPQLGGYHAQEFKRAISEARIDALRDGVDIPLTVKKRSFI